MEELNNRELNSRETNQNKWVPSEPKSMTSSPLEQQTLNQPTAQSPPVKPAASSTSTPPEMIPYARFKEVNDKYRSTEQQMHSLRQELDAVMKINQARSNHFFLPPGLEPGTFESSSADPGALLDSEHMGTDFMDQLLDRMLEHPTITEFINESKNKVYEKYPTLNSEKGKYFVSLYADLLADQLPQNTPLHHLYEQAAQEINEFISALGSEKKEAESAKQQLKIQEKRQAFTEGSGNLVPPQDLYQSALKKAMKTGNVEDLIRLKIQRLNDR